MAKFIVTKAIGDVFILRQSGDKIKLQTGDLVESGEKILTENGATVALEDANGAVISYGERTEAQLPLSLIATPEQTAPAAQPQRSVEPAAEQQVSVDKPGENFPSDSTAPDNGELHDFFETVRVPFGSDLNLSYARDINVTAPIEGRASLNPRIKYDYSKSIEAEKQSYKVEYHPFDGGRNTPDAKEGFPYEPFAALKADDIGINGIVKVSAATAEDNAVVIDPTALTDIPDGMELTIKAATAHFGRVIITPEGKLLYTPDADYHGEDSITCVITDPGGNSYESVIAVTVTPVADTIDDSGSVTENSSVDINVLANDKFADLPGAKVVEVTQGEKGTVTLNPDGTVKYTPTIDYLAAGESTTDTYTYKVLTSAGNYEEASVTITITGTNDAPVISKAAGDSDSAVVTETHSALSADGALTLTDIDVKDTVHTTVEAVSVSGYSGSGAVPGYEVLKNMLSLTEGTLSSTESGGKISWHFNSGSEYFNFLAKDESLTLKYTVKSTDDSGTENDNDTHEIIITIKGTDNAPVVTPITGDVTEDAQTTPATDDTTSVRGNIITTHVTDADATDTHVISKVNNAEANVGTKISGTYGDITIEADGSYIYTLRNTDGNVQALAQGETENDVFAVTVKDSKGDETTQNLTITVNGTNDAPVISLTADDSDAGSVVESDAKHLTDNGTLTLTDSDLHDTVSTVVTKVEVSGTGQHSGYIPANDALRSMLTASGSLSNTQTTGTISWNFDSGEKTFDYLAAGETLELKYTIKATDSSGAVVERPVTVTVTGTNDTPAITVETGDTVSHDFNENGAALTTAGTLTLTDLDLTDNTGSSVTKVAVSGNAANIPGLPDSAALLAMLKTGGSELDATEIMDKINWSFNSGANTFDYLGQGQELILTYTIQAKDDNNITDSAKGEISASNEQTVTIKIIGTNSAPVLVNDSVTVTEDNGATDGTTPDVATSSANIFTNDSDPDDSGKANWKVTSAQGKDASQTPVSSDETSTVAGKYGTLKLNSDGTYTYLLNNTSESIQKLGHDGEATDTFTLWVKDGELEAKQETLTVTVKGTNDRPEIKVAGTGDSSSAQITESSIDTFAGKTEATGTLTFSDADLGDKVTASLLGNTAANFTISGNTSGLISTTDELYKMLKLTNTEFTTEDGTKSHQLTWTFDSGDERFKYLKAGEKLELTYKVQVKDDSGVTANDINGTQDIVITINGSNSADDKNPTPDIGNVKEDAVLKVSGHTGTITGTNQNLLYNDEADGYITGFKIAGDETLHAAGTGTATDIKIGETIIGTLTINANGTYTFTAKNNYSGAVPQITYNTSEGKSSTLDITVTPVADKPTWTMPAPGGNEDTAIALGLKLPTITDNTDLNGDTAGDHAERLGCITLTVPTGAVIYNGDTALSATGGNILIAIVDGSGKLDTSLHYTGLDLSSAVKLTQAQFEALTIKPTEQSGADITGVKLTVTSYETNDTGIPLQDADGNKISASSSTSIKVDVTAVTDAQPDIKIGDSDNPTTVNWNAAITAGKLSVVKDTTVADGVKMTDDKITFAEDSGTLTLSKDFIKAALKNSANSSAQTPDLDGSEKYSITIEGLVKGSYVNGVKAGADGKVTIVTDGTITADKIDNLFANGLTITPPANFSGTLTGIKITVNAWDVDPDTNTAGEVRTDTISLPDINVTPVPDGVRTISVAQAIGKEDTPIALRIKPVSGDSSEGFNVTVKDIPTGSVIIYNGDPYSVSADNSVTIKGFDSKLPLTITPPKDSNADFKLKVSAVSVESDGTVSAPSADIVLAVTVRSVADSVSITTNAVDLTYTELQAENQEISLAKLIVKTDDASDGSEQVTLTVTGLADEFTLGGAAVEYKGGEGTGRTWLVTMNKGSAISATDAYIITPANFSGEIKFTAQATNTDSSTGAMSDSNSTYSDKTDVTITVTPTPEATVHSEATAPEDILQQLSFAIQHKNGDNDETLTSIYIKASEVDAGSGKNFSIFYSEDGGKTTLTLQEANDAGKITLEDGYYKIAANTQGSNVDTIFVKGNAEYSGINDSLTIKYAVTDKAYTGKGTATESTPVTVVSNDMDYKLSFTPVTDKTTMSALKTEDITIADSNADGKFDILLEGTTVKVNSGSDNSFTVKATVQAPTDIDGSEHFVKLIVDGVPDGVSVVGGKYLGDSGAIAGTGRWLLTVEAGKVFDSADKSFATNITFNIDRGNPNIWALNGKAASVVKITAISQDIQGERAGEEEASATEAEFGLQIYFTGTGLGLTDIPAPDITLEKGSGTTEDATGCSLGDFIKATYALDATQSQGETQYRFSFTIKGFPEGTVISGDAVAGGKVTIDADGSVKISGFGDQTAMQSVLDDVKVELPADYNNNTDGSTSDGLNLEVTWNTKGWDLNSFDAAPADHTGTTTVTPEVTPVTDPMAVTLSSDKLSINENQAGSTNALSFNVKIEAGNDGEYGVIQNDGKLYLKLEGAKESDTLTYKGQTYSLEEVTAADGIPAGKYYIVTGVKAGDSLDFSYVPSAFYSGAVKVSALLASKELGASELVKAEGDLNLTVNAVNTEYHFTVDNATAVENTDAILTNFAKTGLFDTDGSEKIYSIVISGFDTEHADDFTVSYKVDGVEKTASKVASDSGYEWVLSTDSKGELPQDVKITSLNNYSGTQHLTMTVVTGETSLGSGRENKVNFDVTFTPKADGFSSFAPDLTFGTAGAWVDLNLNAMVNDTSNTAGTETATVQLKGLGDGVSFSIGRDTTGDGQADTFEAVKVSYNSDSETYTLSNIALLDINNIKILTPQTGTKTITVDAWTVESENTAEGDRESIHTKADGLGSGTSFDIQIEEPESTSGDDRFIYTGSGSYDGKAGTDTLFMANYRTEANSGKNSLDFAAAPDIKNIEIIDMSDGNHVLKNLTADAVKNMTDADNKLIVKGESGDEIALSSGWTKASASVNADNYWTYTNNGATLLVSDGITVESVK